MSAGTAVSAQAHVRSARMGMRQNALQSPVGIGAQAQVRSAGMGRLQNALQSPVGIGAQAHVRAAHVKTAFAAGRSQNKVRESLGIPLLPAGVETEE